MKDRSWWKPFQFPIDSPQGFLVMAAFFVLGFFLVWLLGFREYMTVLTGSPPADGTSMETGAMLGGLYLVLYFLVLLGSPVLVAAAGILWGLQRLWKEKPAPVPEPDPPAEETA